MADSVFAVVLEAAWRHRRIVLGAVAVAIAFGLWVLATVPLDSDVAFMLPADPEVQQAMTFLRESDLSDRVVLSLQVAPDAGGVDALLAASARLESSLGPPFVRHVESGVSGESFTSEIRHLLTRMPELTRESDLREVDGRLTPDGIDAMLRGSYRQLIGPGELFAKEPCTSWRLVTIVSPASHSIGTAPSRRSGAPSRARGCGSPIAACAKACWCS